MKGKEKEKREGKKERKKEKKNWRSVQRENKKRTDKERFLCGLVIANCILSLSLMYVQFNLESASPLLPLIAKLLKQKITHFFKSGI